MISKFLLSSSSQKGLMIQRAVGRAAASTTTTTGLLDASSPSSSSPPSSPSSPPIFTKIACIGTGTICSALVEPMIRTGLQPADHFCMYDVDLRALKATAQRFPGVQTASSLAQAVDAADVILLAVKPQNLTPAFFAEFRQPHVGLHTLETLDKAILLSVVAGKPMDCFLNAGFKKVVRSMPNTPATIGEGMTVWSATNNLNLLERGKIDAMLSSCGSSMYVDDETKIDMATSISGSGPAYIFLLMEAMVDAGVHMGFPRDQATKLVYQTMLGSTLYAMKTNEHPAILRNKVTSPSGTTASALYELENGKFRTVIKDAMWACYRRSMEMGGTHDASTNVGPGQRGGSSYHTPP